MSDTEHQEWLKQEEARKEAARAKEALHIAAFHIKPPPPKKRGRPSAPEVSEGEEDE